MNTPKIRLIDQSKPATAQQILILIVADEFPDVYEKMCLTIDASYPNDAKGRKNEKAKLRRALAKFEYV